MPSVFLSLLMLFYVVLYVWQPIEKLISLNLTKLSEDEKLVNIQGATLDKMIIHLNVCDYNNISQST